MLWPTSLVIIGVLAFIAALLCVVWLGVLQSRR